MARAFVTRVMHRGPGARVIALLMKHLALYGITLLQLKSNSAVSRGSFKENS